MIPINQLNCFLHYRKFSLILTLAVTAFTQISPAQATFREDANTLKTLKLSNVKSESVSTDALSQNKKPLKKNYQIIAI